MAQKLYEESNIQAIANAIRGKNGLTNTYKTSEMAAAISAIESGGGDFPEELIHYTGDCSYKFYRDAWKWVLDKYGSQITTENITNCDSMFLLSNTTSIPFSINCDNTKNIDLGSCFSDCKQLLNLPIFNNCRVYGCPSMFAGCNNLREIPNDFINSFDWSFLISVDKSYSGGTSSSIISRCYSLRTFPVTLFEILCSSSHGAREYYPFYGSGSCYVMDEVINIPVITHKTFTSNLMWNFGDSFSRIKNFTFATNDGAPKVAQWKSTIIDLTHCVGYAQDKSNVRAYNSGIIADKQVKDDATYQALKNDPDWFTTKVEYSRYNHDSAVATINSLPDTSAYLASAGGTNTIIFKGAAGSATDGGAINTLTKEEIAVATAKGWTVTLN